MSQHAHSRLGHVLIHKKLITPAQLDAAISQQLISGKRLGEVLREQGLLTEQQLHKALSRQTNLRITATLIAALLSPFQLASAETRVAAMQSTADMQPLTDSQMSSYSAQGLDQALQNLLVQNQSGAPLATVTQLAKLINPVLDQLESEQRSSNVHYDTNAVKTSFNRDGSINVQLPSSIGEMHFDNIRIKGAPIEQSLGSISLYNIDLSQASLKIWMHP